jgi:DNA-binding NarL/FixJ family response regulator
MSQPLRILIVDDQPHARRSLRALLAAKFRCAEVNEAEDGSEAIRFVERSKPDVIVMDVVMPGGDGLDATRRIKVIEPDIRVVVLSMYREYRGAALLAGADAFVSKGEQPEVLLRTLVDMVGSASAGR